MKLAWWIGAVVGALAPPGGCVGFIAIAPRLAAIGRDRAEGTLVIETRGATTRFQPDHCVAGFHTDSSGAMLTGGGYTLDVVERFDHTTTAFLRGPGLPHELELAAPHCTRLEITSKPEYDDDDELNTGLVDVTCAFDAAGITGRIEYKRCR